MFTVSTTEKGLGDNDGHIATVTMDINTGCWGLIKQKKTTLQFSILPYSDRGRASRSLLFKKQDSYKTFTKISAQFDQCNNTT